MKFNIDYSTCIHKNAYTWHDQLRKQFEFFTFCSPHVTNIVPFYRIRNRGFPKVAEHLLLRTRAESQKAIISFSISLANISVTALTYYKSGSWKLRSL